MGGIFLCPFGPELRMEQITDNRYLNFNTNKLAKWPNCQISPNFQNCENTPKIGKIPKNYQIIQKLSIFSKKNWVHEVFINVDEVPLNSQVTLIFFFKIHFGPFMTETTVPLNSQVTLIFFKKFVLAHL